MTKHTHKLDIVTACEQCLIDRCRERDALLNFVMNLTDCDGWTDEILKSLPGRENEISLEARNLLKELGLWEVENGEIS